MVGIDLENLTGDMKVCFLKLKESTIVRGKYLK